MPNQNAILELLKANKGSNGMSPDRMDLLKLLEKKWDFDVTDPASVQQGIAKMRVAYNQTKFNSSGSTAQDILKDKNATNNLMDILYQGDTTEGVGTIFDTPIYDVIKSTRVGSK